MAFPTSPTNGQTYTVNGIIYVYNSTKTAWQIQSSGSATVPTTVGTNLSITGNFAASGTMSVTGNANVGNIGTATAIATTGNITTINSGLIQNGNSNVAIAANGAVSLAANGLVRATFDTSGRMILPYQPSFQATRASGAGNQSLANDSIVFQFTDTFHNVGGHYNTSTYRFTAPVAGRYLFCATARIDGATAGGYMRVLFLINGGNGGYRYGMTISGNNHSTDYESLSVSAILNLAQNDYVEAAGGRNAPSSNLQFESQFSGIFLG